MPLEVSQNVQMVSRKRQKIEHALDLLYCGDANNSDSSPSEETMMPLTYKKKREAEESGKTSRL